MLDTYIQGITTTQYVPYVKTVKEIRAPTDESIRIYEEVKEKAYKSILDSFYLDSNVFKAFVMVHKDIYSDETVCRYKFTLNNKEYQNEFRSRDFDIKDKSDIIRKVIKGISDEIVIELTKKIYEQN